MDELISPSGSAEAIREIERLAAAGVKIDFAIPAISDEQMPVDAVTKALPLLIASDGKGGITKISIASEIDAIRGKPVRRKGTAKVQSLGSFIDLTARHADKDSAIFADMNWQAPKFTAIINYHKQVPELTAAQAPSKESLARYGDHRIEFAFPLSEPWKVWLANNGKVMPQAEFAQFLEDHIMEVSSPTDAERDEWRAVFGSSKALATAADLITFSRDLEIMVGATYKSKTRLQSGEVGMVFETTHSGPKGEEISIPPGFVIQLPIFYGAQKDRIAARLRYRAAGQNGVMWFYELHRPDIVIEERLRADLDNASQETGLPAYEGSPEAA